MREANLLTRDGLTLLQTGVDATLDFALETFVQILEHG